ncbi:MAG TPA: acetate/propionate family kinase [Dehalococcoidia bacterium]|nr:acetate/propionate family kinase [Dehalococcoidia bacterium]
MNVLTVNCGSSSLKVRLCAVDQAGASTLWAGAVEAIGPGAAVVLEGGDAAHVRRPVAADDHAAALAALMELVPDEARRSIEAVGHRVVRGGAFATPSIIDGTVIRAIEAGQRVAPLHNRPALQGIAAAREMLPGVPMVAVFDTTFHNALPPAASHYALPHELTLKHGLRRSGYHGIAHRSMTERYAEVAGTGTAAPTIITLQLGHGCSATAVREGVSVDTSMGFTPIEGLIMGTRPGDLDAGALAYLLREEGLSADDLDDILNHRSGLLGISGSSGDMAVLLAEESRGQPRAHDAIEMFCYRVRKYVGAYAAVLGRADAIVFGGGIGERSAEIRRRICEPLEGLGVRLDGQRNAALADGEGRISMDGSQMTVWVIPSDEERIIARDTFDLLARVHGQGRDT